MDRSQRKYFDVARPGSFPESPTSKPIVGQRPSQPDPMIRRQPVTSSRSVPLDNANRSDDNQTTTSEDKIDNAPPDSQLEPNLYIAKTTPGLDLETNEVKPGAEVSNENPASSPAEVKVESEPELKVITSPSEPIPDINNAAKSGADADIGADTSTSYHAGSDVMATAPVVDAASQTAISQLDNQTKQTETSEVLPANYLHEPYSDDVEESVRPSDDQPANEQQASSQDADVKQGFKAKRSVGRKIVLTILTILVVASAMLNVFLLVEYLNLK